MLQTRQGGRRSLHAEFKAPQGHASQPWLSRPGTPRPKRHWLRGAIESPRCPNRLVVACSRLSTLVRSIPQNAMAAHTYMAHSLYLDCDARLQRWHDSSMTRGYSKPFRLFLLRSDDDPNGSSTPSSKLPTPTSACAIQQQ